MPQIHSQCGVICMVAPESAFHEMSALLRYKDQGIYQSFDWVVSRMDVLNQVRTYSIDYSSDCTNCTYIYKNQAGMQDIQEVQGQQDQE